DLFGAGVRVELHLAPRALEEGEGRGAEVDLETGSGRVDVVLQRDPDARRVVERPGDGLGERVVVRANRHGVADGVGLAAGACRELEARAVARRRGEIEADLPAAAGLEALVLPGAALEPDPARRRVDPDPWRPTHPRVEDDARGEAVAFADEAGERGARDERAGDEELRVAGPVAVARGHGDGHDPEGRQVVRELRRRRRVPVRIGDDGSEEEGGRLEAGPEDPGHIVAAAAAGLAPALLSV